ncbi:HAMP domain-containing sensor histidine kinase [Nocardioides sp. CCNWLW239]|uniref:sensor histidine kinase n=1 Tax=Nocardioides sp. CCNWLW239 TaxID=3128902 RepID=UPI0030176FF5
MRRWPIRARIALLSAVVVALAIVLASVFAWTATRATLLRQIDSSLGDRLVIRGAIDEDGKRVTAFSEGLTERMCEDPPVLPPELAAQDAPVPKVQLLRADGSVCLLGEQERLVEPDAEERAVAESGHGEVVRDTTTDEGTRVRVLTKAVEPGLAAQSVRSLEEVDATLRSLAGLLGLASLLGVLLAAFAGMLLARFLVGPIERLTAAAEYVAATDDLDVPLDVEHAEGSRDEVSRLSVAFHAMMTRLAGSRRRQQQLVADAGHELRTPVTSLRTNVEWLMRLDDSGRPLPPEQRRRVAQAVLGQVEELADLVTELSHMARGNGDTDVAPGPVQVDEVVLRAVERAQRRDPARRFDLDLEPHRITGDPAALERAVVNLLDNALKFSDGPVSVVVRDEELYAADRGPGLSDAEAALAFERFWRAETDRELPGSGLGLAIVAEVSARHGGTPFFRAREGGGSEVGIRFSERR